MRGRDIRTGLGKPLKVFDSLAGIKLRLINIMRLFKYRVISRKLNLVLRLAETSEKA